MHGIVCVCVCVFVIPYSAEREKISTVGARVEYGVIQKKGGANHGIVHLEHMGTLLED